MTSLQLCYLPRLSPGRNLHRARRTPRANCAFICRVGSVVAGSASGGFAGIWIARRNPDLVVPTGTVDWGDRLTTQLPDRPEPSSGRVQRNVMEMEISLGRLVRDSSGGHGPDQKMGVPLIQRTPVTPVVGLRPDLFSEPLEAVGETGAQHVAQVGIKFELRRVILSGTRGRDEGNVSLSEL
jgi:hypothetical protein